MPNWRALVLAVCLAVALTTSAPAASRRGELRGVWLSLEGTTDWTNLAQSLQASGFNAVFLQVGFGWAARYPSDVLPVRLGAAETDALAEAVAAIHAHGLECHAVGFGFNTPGGDHEILESYRQAGRLQCTADGEIVGDQDAAMPGFHYLCPSHPDNRRLLRDAAVELVKKYGVSGVQLPGGGFLVDPETCFCEGCKERFQSQTKVELADWPEDVRKGGRHAATWQQWRRDVLTSLGEEIAEAVQAEKPLVFVSLIDSLALSRLPDAYRQAAELWREMRNAWARGGTLDFICPVLSSGSATSALLLETYIAEARGRLPVYPVLSARDITSVWPLIEQIEAVRAAGADGFVVGAVSPQTLLDWLPDLRATVASADPNPAPHGHPPVRIAFSGEAAAAPATGHQVIAGAKLEVEIVLGWEPPQPDEETAGAAEAGAMLERALDIRDPIDTYDDQRHLPDLAVEEDRLSGRIVVETPEGASRTLLGGFDTAYRFQRKLRFSAPDGRFRLAIYGALKNAADTHDFVVRSPVLVGVPKEDLAADEVHADLSRAVQEGCDRPEAAVLRALAPIAVQLRATGPGGGEWWVQFEGDDCETGEGHIESPDLTFVASASDFAALARGEVGPRALWEQARLEVIADDRTLDRLVEAYSKTLKPPS